MDTRLSGGDSWSFSTFHFWKYASLQTTNTAPETAQVSVGPWPPVETLGCHVKEKAQTPVGWWRKTFCVRTHCSRVCMCVCAVCFLVLPNSAGLQTLESASVSHSVVSDSLGTMDYRPARLLCPRHSPGKNTGVGCHSHLQGIFSTKGMNPGLPHYRQILYCVSHQERPGARTNGSTLPCFLSHILLGR